MSRARWLLLLWISSVIIFGAIMSIATAWLGAIGEQSGWDFSPHDAYSASDGRAFWTIQIDRQPLVDRIHVQCEPGRQMVDVEQLKTPPGWLLPFAAARITPEDDLFLVMPSGWPFRSLTRCSAYRAPRSATKPGTKFELDCRPITSANQLWLLPSTVIWRGMIANIAFYAGGVLIARAAWKSVRRLIRSQRGQCPACAYSRAGLAPNAPCPECGHTSTAASSARC